MSGTIVILTNTASGTALDLAGGKCLPLSISSPKLPADLLFLGDSKDATPVLGWKKHGGQNQQWKLIKVGDRGIWPIYKLQNVKSGTYLDLLNGGGGDSTAVNGWQGSPNPDNNHQNWQLISDISGELVKIQNVGTGTFLDMFNGSSTDGTKVTGWHGPVDLSDTTDTHRVWRVQRV